MAPFDKIPQSNLATLRWLIIVGCAFASLACIGPSSADGQTIDGAAPTGQENDETAKPAQKKPTDNPELDLLYLRTPEGKLVPVPDMSFEDFSRLYKLDKKLTSSNQLPGFELQELRLTGEARETVAHFEAALTIRQLADGPIRVPLKLNEVVVTDETQLRDRTRAIQFDPEKDGYVIWLTGSTNGTHTLKFEFDAPVAREGKQSVLRLNLPAATVSDLRLQVPGTQIQARTQDEKRPVTVVPNADGSLLAVRGVSSKMALEWSDREYQASTQESVVIDAQGFHHVHFRGPGLAATESRFRFVSRGGTLDSVKLRLPAGARLTTEVQNAEYRVTNAPSSDTQRRLLNIWFLEPDKGPRDVVFTTEHTTRSTRNGSSKTEPLETLGYEVIDAVRHFGRVTLATDDTWLLRWQESANVRRVGHDPAKDGADTVAAFEYFQQPAALPVSVLRKATRAVADPSVKLSVLADELTMNLSLDVRVGGAPASFLRIAMPGWQISEVDASNEVSQDEIRLDENNPLVIPFRQPFTGDLNLRVTARRPLPDDVSQQGKFSLRLPFLLEAINGPINLQLVSPPNMIVIPDSEYVEAVADLNTMEPSSNRRSNEIASYVFRGNPESETLICSLATRPQSVQGELNGQVRIEGGVAATRIRMSASVLHEAIDSLRFQFYKAAPDDITVRLDGQRIDPRFHSWAREPADESATLILQMPKPVLGALEVELDYEMPISTGGDSTDSISSIPLPRATIGEVTEGQITVVTAPGLVTKLNDPVWEQRATESNRVVASAERWPADLAITVKAQPGTTAAQTHTIERVFWQTWLTATERQDRGVFVLTTNEDSIDVQLPRQMQLEGLRAMVNGKVVAPLPTSDSGFRLSISPSDERTIVELFCPYGQRSKRTSLQLPSIERANWTRKLHWQVVLPNDEFLIAPPIGVESEDAWSATDLLTGHQSRVTQMWLENWAGGTQQTPPSPNQNTYVFSSFGAVPPCQLRTAKRSSLLLYVAGAILGLGLFPGFFHSLQRPRFFVAIAILLALAALMFPVHTLLIAPAAAFGAALLVISQAIRWWKQQQPRWRLANRTDSSRLYGSPTTPAVPTAQTTISSLPPMHVSAPDN